METELRWEEPTIEELDRWEWDLLNSPSGAPYESLSPDVIATRLRLWQERIADPDERWYLHLLDSFRLAKAVRFEQSALARYETLALRVEELVGPEHERPPKHWRDLVDTRDRALELLRGARDRVAELTSKVLGPAA